MMKSQKGIEIMRMPNAHRKVYDSHTPSSLSGTVPTEFQDIGQSHARFSFILARILYASQIVMSLPKQGCTAC